MKIAYIFTNEVPFMKVYLNDHKKPASTKRYLVNEDMC
jgi:hypothetical protein